MSSISVNPDVDEIVRRYLTDKEDFEKFTEGLEEVIKFIRTNCLKDEGRPAGSSFTDVEFEEL
jgi:hypothetical protein